MENLKRCNHGDLLRDLPDCLIFDIFWRLPMTDVVRTSLLSKRWRNFWTTAPFLNFDNHAMLFDYVKLRNFVNRALLCWNGNRILKFRFNSDNDFASPMFNDVDMWVNFALRNGVEVLHLHVWCGLRSDRRVEVYHVPPCLYSCSSLKELSLHCSNSEIYGNVQWNKLESLTINAYRVTVNVINQILSATPQLKVFNLTYKYRGGILSIQSTSLKQLSIFKRSFSSREDYSMAAELRICTPNLETLEINGPPYKKYLLTDVSSLKRAVFCLTRVGHYKEAGWLPNPLSKILPSIQHAENIELSYCCTEELGAMKMKCADSAFRNVKSLELGCCAYYCKQVVGILEIFPQLERLVINDFEEDGRQDDAESLKFEENLPESFLLRLRTIQVIWSEGYYGIFPLIAILLKYASKLEKFVFQLNEIESPVSSDSLYLVSQKLLGMRRSSYCTIHLTKYSHEN